MLSKNKIKYIHSLELKKTRKEEQVFLAEGPKLTNIHWKATAIATALPRIVFGNISAITLT